MKKIIYTSFVITVLFAGTSFAQTISPDVIASAGDHFSSAAGSVSWTIGEPVTDTYSSPSNVLTKGFHQPAVVLLSSVEENSAGSFYVYPNPVTDMLILDFSKMKNGDYEIVLYDVTGQEVSKRFIDWRQGGKPEQVSMQEIRAGMYFVRITGPSSGTIVLRIIKQ
jgi:hypothetical protein